jgi:surface protein
MWEKGSVENANQSLVEAILDKAQQTMSRICLAATEMKFVRSDTDMKGAVELWCSNESAAIERYGNISEWDTAAVTTMKELFKNAKNFNGDVSKWNVSNVTTMSYMFSDAAVFNGDVSKWNVSNVTTMSCMFQNAKVFNGDVSKWNVSNVTNKANTFTGAALPEKYKPVFKG